MSRHIIVTLSILLLLSHQSRYLHYMIIIVYHMLKTYKNIVGSSRDTFHIGEIKYLYEMNDIQARPSQEMELSCSKQRSISHFTRVHGTLFFHHARCGGNKVGCSFIMTLHFHEARSGQLPARIMNFPWQYNHHGALATGSFISACIRYSAHPPRY